MSGMSRTTGKLIKSDREHLRQSLIDILTTPLGSRVTNRAYGSRLFDLIDRPATESIDFAAAITEAITKFEPRFDLESVQVKNLGGGRLEIELLGKYKPTQERVLERIGI